MSERPAVTVEIRPRAQFRAFLESTLRWDCLVVHRRGGKTFGALQKLLKRALTHRRPGPPKRYAYIAPTRDQAKDIVWGYLKRFTAGIPGVAKNEADLTVTLADGTMIRLYSGENYERMRGLYFDGVVIDEPEDIDPLAWSSVIRACLSDYQGWAIWIGTVKGKKGQWKRLMEAMEDPEWFALLLRASESGIIPAAELESIKRDAARQNRLDIYAQEYECDPNIGIPGTLFAGFVTDALRAGRVLDFPWERSELVWSFWDLGSPENMRCTYVQFVGREIHIIDHDADLRDPEMTPAKRVAHMLALGYPYGGHFFPHDAAAREKSGLNFQQQMTQAGLEHIRIIPQCRSIWPGVNKLAEIFPRLVFHKGKTTYLLESLENYRRKIDKDGNVTDTIHQDWACHSTDSMRMLAEAMLNGLLKGHSEVIRETRPSHQRQRKASAGRYGGAR
jgi:phage terminase large subunit